MPPGFVAAWSRIEWTPTNRILLFELRNDYRGVTLQVQLGPGPRHVRESLFAAAQASPVYNRTSKTLGKKWNTLFGGLQVISATELDELDQDEVESRVAEFWTAFAASDLPEFVEELLPAIEKLA